MVHFEFIFMCGISFFYFSVTASSRYPQCHTIHPFKMYSPMAFSIVMVNFKCHSHGLREPRELTPMTSGCVWRRLGLHRWLRSEADPSPVQGGLVRPTDAPTEQKAEGHICPLCCSWDAQVFLPSDIGSLILGPWSQSGIHTHPSWCSSLWTADGEPVLCSKPPFIHVCMYPLGSTSLENLDE